MGGITKIWESNCSVSFICVSVNGVEWGHRQSSGVRFCFLLTKQNPKPEHREHRAQCQTGSCGLNNALYLNVTLKTSVWTFLVFVTDNRRSQHIPVGRQCVLSLFCRGYFNKIPSKASEMAQWYRQPLPLWPTFDPKGWHAGRRCPLTAMRMLWLAWTCVCTPT